MKIYKKKIIFDGAYGIDSFGDDAALIIISKKLKKLYKYLDLVAVSRHAASNSYKKYGIRTIEGIEHATKKQSIGKFFYGFNYDDDRNKLLNLYQEIKSSNLLILGAGNMINEISLGFMKGNMFRMLIVSLIARVSNVPILWLGISATPLKTTLGKKLLHVLVNLTNKINLRDHSSLGIFKKNLIKKKISITSDIVYAINVKENHELNFKEYVNAHKNPNGVISISLRSTTKEMGIAYQDYINLMSNVSDQLIDDWDVSILFIPQCIYKFGTYDQDDRNVAKDIILKSKNKKKMFRIKNSLNFEECYTLYKRSKVSICTRLHGNVFSVRNSIPTVGISYNPKVFNFFKFFKIEKYCLDAKYLSKEKLIEKVEMALKNKEKFNNISKKVYLEGLNTLDKSVKFVKELL